MRTTCWINMAEYPQEKGVASLYLQSTNMLPVVVLPDLESEVKDDCLVVDFLLPNGIIMPITTNFYKPFEIVKQEVWKEAEKYPLFKLLKRSDSYWFVCLNKHGEREEILDESQCLSDIRPYSTFLKLVEREGDERHKTLVRNMNSLIGKGMAYDCRSMKIALETGSAGPISNAIFTLRQLQANNTHKVEAWQSAEVADFRTTMRQMCDRIVQERNRQGWHQALLHRFPPRLRPTKELPAKMKEKLTNGNIMMEVLIKETQSKYTMQVSEDSTPAYLIQSLLLKLSRAGKTLEDHTNYLLKSYGIEEYIYGKDYPLKQYKFVYQCLVKNMAPQFLLVARENVIDSRPAVPPRRPCAISDGDINIGPSRSEKEICVWDISDKYYFTIRGIGKVQLPDSAKVKLFMGLYHGSESLCALKTSNEVVVQSGECNMKMDIVFDIAARDLPHMARLCFTLCATGKKKDLTPVGWVNVAVFDFRSRLTRGDRDLPMWTWKDEMQSEEFCYPIGSVAPNAQGNEATTLLIKFPDFNQKSNIRYPAFDKVLECAANNMEPNGTPGNPMMKPSKTHLDQLKQLISGDSLGLLFEQDKELLWMMRYECRHQFAHTLPKVLSSVKWNSHVDVAKMIALLQTWPKLEVDFALQLLGFNYPDKNVRKFAVSCLEDKQMFSDDELSRYLLQLVQALKYETHLCNPLVEFLLTRALGNQHIGHKLFWLIKSELHNAYVSVQFRLILEVYLAASGDHMMALHKEQEALGKLCLVNGIIKRYNMADQKSQEQAKKDMQAVLEQKTYQEILCNLYSPLSPLFKLLKLDIQRCRFMKSKKRPLWLVWKNDFGSDVSLIYKNGDDLRQDMLTLQMLEIMDNIWQSEGLDLRMNVYRCLATGQEQGVIEAVGQSETIAKIQKWFNKGAFDKKAVYEWLKSHHTPESLDEAVEEFILSCAGYCVATYVLGIGDRHNDNIMLKQSGQLFHIDFGHFLGNFKSKFGVRRDRVPFVLTTHFVYVIQKGNTNKDNFTRFQGYCEKAYLILRRKSHLLFSLFLMMLSSGIPQLMCVKDVDYLRETLKPDLSEDEAREHFRTRFREALKNSWTASLQFCIHMMANN